MTHCDYDVFLSYNRAQKDWTRNLARRLRDAGFRVWFDEWCLRGGENWIVGLRRGVNESRHVVCVTSPEFFANQWPRFETYIAILDDPAAGERKLIPVFHTPCELPPELAFRQGIDFSNTHTEPTRYEFRLAQLMADLDPSRERPTDFETFRARWRPEEPEVIPVVGPLPRGSLMPMRPNPHFVGREDELRELERMLRAGSTTAIGQVAAATGLGGIGKTQLAVEYAHRYGRRYPGGVFWLDVSDPEAIPSQAARCGGVEGMNLPGSANLSLPDQVAQVRAEWASRTIRLLIFDNVEQPGVVEAWRPATGGCRVLITSRCADWPATMGVETVPLATLPRDKAVELLCKGRAEALEDAAERQAADEICDVLGDLPLAVALAGSYLAAYRHDVTLADYLAELEAQPVLSHPTLVNFVDDPLPTRHIQNVAATFELSYRRLDPQDETDLLAMHLFHLAGHFAPASISRELLLKAAHHPPSPLLVLGEGKGGRGDGVRAYADALRRLTRLGLVEEEAEGRLLLHRLLAAFARQHPAPGQTQEEGWEAVANTVREFAYEQNQSGLPAALAREVAHLRHLANVAEQRGWSEAGGLYNELGYHLKMLAAYAEARAAYERALAIWEETLGPEHPNVASAVNNLGVVLKDLGDLAGARAAVERALAIDEAVFGAEHPNVATDVNNLGLVLQALGDLAGARAAYERALAIDEAVFGADHPNVARDVNNLGGVLQALGDLAGARAACERALAIFRRFYGEDHPRTQIVLGNLRALEEG